MEGVGSFSDMCWLWWCVRGDGGGTVLVICGDVVVCGVVRSGVWWWVEVVKGMHFSQLKNAISILDDLFSFMKFLVLKVL